MGIVVKKRIIPSEDSPTDSAESQTDPYNLANDADFTDNAPFDPPEKYISTYPFGDRGDMADEIAEKRAPVTCCQWFTHILSVFFLVAILINSILCIAAGGCCLYSLSGKPFDTFPLFYSFGIAPLALGCISFPIITGLLGYISLRKGGIKKYGLCCVRPTYKGRVCDVCLLGVLPFFVMFFLFVLTLAGFTIFALSLQIPSTTSKYKSIKGLNGPIEIIRDENGLSHIKATNRRDAYFGQGFASAQDRLFQLEFHRLVAKGHLSSYVGSAGNYADTSIRTLNIPAAGYALCKNMKPDQYDLLKAYSEGINQFLFDVTKRPVEFFFMSRRLLFFHEPEPFTPEDLCLTARYYQWQMSSNLEAEGARFSVWAYSQRLHYEIEELFPKFEGDNNTVLGRDALINLLGLNNSDPATIEKTINANIKAQKHSEYVESTIYDFLFSFVRNQLNLSVPVSIQAEHKTPRAHIQSTLQSLIPSNYFFHGKNNSNNPSIETFANKYIYASNAWVTRDEQGRTMAASDPHLTMNLPSIWYYSHLSFPKEANDDNDIIEEYEVAGVGLLGIPGVHIGRTNKLAWGITMSMTDLEDLFIFPPSPYSYAPNGSYLYNNKTYPFIPRQERISVRGGSDIVLNIEDTVLGPIVSEMVGFPSFLKVALSAVALRTDDNTSMDALFAFSDPSIEKAEQLMKKMLLLQAPGFSIPITDIHGTLSLAVTGRHPIRPVGHTGKYPVLAFNTTAFLQLICLEFWQYMGIPQDPNKPCFVPDVNWQKFFKMMDIDSFSKFLKKEFFIVPWQTYVDKEDGYVPPEKNPHYVSYFTPQKGSNNNNETNPFYIVAGNNKLLPDGYNYFFGADYAWGYRAARIKSLLEKNKNVIHLTSTHHGIQLDDRSNVFIEDFRPIILNESFYRYFSNNPFAMAWRERLLLWDGHGAIGSSEMSFFYLFLQKLAAFPQDAVLISKKLWPVNRRYSVIMLTTPSLSAKNECTNYLEDVYHIDTYLNYLNSLNDSTQTGKINSIDHLDSTTATFKTITGKPTPITAAPTNNNNNNNKSALGYQYSNWKDIFSFPKGNGAMSRSEYYKKFNDCINLAAILFTELAETYREDAFNFPRGSIYKEMLEFNYINPNNNNNNNKRIPYWGKDLSQLTGVHEMLQGTLLAPVFQRSIDKNGDFSSVSVNDAVIDGSMPSTQASSVRLINNLWNNATINTINTRNNVNTRNINIDNMIRTETIPNAGMDEITFHQLLHERNSMIDNRMKNGNNNNNGLPSDYHVNRVSFVSFPGGNNGNPYSFYYQNLWNKYQHNIYVITPTEYKSVKKLKSTDVTTIVP